MRRKFSVFFAMVIVFLTTICFAETIYIPDLSSASTDDLLHAWNAIEVEYYKRENNDKTKILESISYKYIDDDYIHINEAALFPESGRYCYFLLVQSKLDDQVVKFPEFRITLRNFNGKVLASDYYSPWFCIMPNQPYAMIGLQGPHISNISDSELQSACVEVECKKESSEFTYPESAVQPEEIVNGNSFPLKLQYVDVCKDVTSYSSPIVGEVANPNNDEVQRSRLTVVFRNQNGIVVGGKYIFIENVQPLENTPFSLHVDTDVITDNYNVYSYIDSVNLD